MVAHRLLLAPFRLIPPISIVLFALMLWTFVQSGLPSFLADPGVGWHLRTGQVISETWQIPRVDPFLASATPRSWVSDQWLADLLLWKIYSLGGFALLAGVYLAIFLGIYFGFVYPMIVAATGSAVLASIGTMFAIKASEIHFILRPVAFSYVLFAVVALTAYRAGDSPKRRLLLPLLFLVWANLHPGFIVGLVFLGLEVLEALGQRALGRAAKRSLVVGLCGLATLVNPYGIGLHQSILALGQSSYFMGLHQEWLGVQVSSPEAELVFQAFGLYLIGFVFTIRRVRPRLLEVFAVLLFSYLPFYAVRFLPFFGIVITVPLARVLKVLFDRLPAWKWLEAREPHRIPYLWLILAIIVGDSLVRDRILWYRGPIAFSAEKYPQEAVVALNAHLAAQTPQAESVVVLNPPFWGGYLAFTVRGAKPVMDDRNTLLGETFYRHFMETFAAQTNDAWQGLATEVAADYMILPSVSPLADEVRRAPNWSVLHDDPTALVVVRAVVQEGFEQTQKEKS